MRKIFPRRLTAKHIEVTLCSSTWKIAPGRPLLCGQACVEWLYCQIPWFSPGRLQRIQPYSSRLFALSQKWKLATPQTAILAFRTLCRNHIPLRIYSFLKWRSAFDFYKLTWKRLSITEAIINNRCMTHPKRSIYLRVLNRKRKDRQYPLSAYFSSSFFFSSFLAWELRPQL